MSAHTSPSIAAASGTTEEPEATHSPTQERSASEDCVGTPGPCTEFDSPHQQPFTNGINTHTELDGREPMQHAGAPYAMNIAPGYANMLAAPMQSPHAMMPSMVAGQPPLGWNGTVPYMMPMGYAPSYGAPYTHVAPEYNGVTPRMQHSPMPMAPVGRTVYVGNIPPEATVAELLSLVKFGPIDNVRMLPEKNCAFISFLSGQFAAAFHADSSVKRVSLHNQELKIGWGKPSVPPPDVLMAVQQHQASRNVYIGQLDEHITEQDLRDSLGRFGPIDQVKIVRDQGIGFVHFLSIQTAMKVVSILPTEPNWSKKRINFGKDRCAYVPKGQQQIQAHNNQAAAMGLAAATWLGYPTGCFQPYYERNNTVRGGEMDPEAEQARANLTSVEPQYHQLGNRTVYLGNLHQDTTAEDICNHVRGGILQNVRYLPDRHIAFVTFIDSNAALAFFHLASGTGITIHNRRLKIGWGKPSGPLSPALALAVQSGASRNVYMGNIDDPKLMNEDKIRADLSEFGTLEMAFANFTNIQSAIKCIEALKHCADYTTIKISYGKDRCGNPPRQLSKLPISWANSRNKQPLETAKTSNSAEALSETSTHK
ncbi:hypothetical protein MVES_000199 [Malassezia vespertilionis]|uniref:RRM domain-containing protein n=1 Tax=Malassezia vespertilionis TaxID=2020962 RepID=A0A2N1JH36_9BASI|nr:hypothetical protein MVES_000199 [Malassezia vespertilionis]